MPLTQFEMPGHTQLEYPARVPEEFLRPPVDPEEGSVSQQVLRLTNGCSKRGDGPRVRSAQHEERQRNRQNRTPIFVSGFCIAEQRERGRQGGRDRDGERDRGRERGGREREGGRVGDKERREADRERQRTMERDRKKWGEKERDTHRGTRTESSERHQGEDGERGKEGRDTEGKGQKEQ